MLFQPLATAAAGALLFLGAASVLGAQTPPSCAVERDRLFVSGGSGINYIGYAMAFEQDTLFVGAPRAEGPGSRLQGAVYLFRRHGTSWRQGERLFGSDAGDGAFFGYAMDVDGERLVVGAHNHALPGASGAGAAYVFERVGGTWVETAKLVDPDPAPGTSFGRAVDVEGDTLVVGAYRDDDFGAQAGSAHVFERLGGVWVHRAELHASDPAPNRLFGQDLDLEGSTLAVSAPGIFNPGSAVHVFEGAGGSWTEVARLTPSAADYDLFGTSLDLDGDRLAVGCRYVTPGSVPLAGAVYVFERSGSTWSQVAEVTAANPDPFELMGYRVALRGDVLLTGAITAAHAGPSSGAAYYFVHEGGAWRERQLLLPTGVEGDENFGRSLVWDEETLFVSADALSTVSDPRPGSVFVFDWLAAPATYCAGKTSSDGCVPFVTTAGTPSVSGTAPFLVEGRDVLEGQFGLLLYGRAPAQLGFHGGTLCVKAPLRRLLPPSPSPSQGPPPCNGLLRRNFNATIQAGLDPALTVGRTVCAQWLQRDPADPAGFGDGLTDAVRFTVCP